MTFVIVVLTIVSPSPFTIITVAVTAADLH
jgi:hypothetical protein